MHICGYRKPAGLILGLPPVVVSLFPARAATRSHHLPGIDVLELTQQHHESDRASEGLNLFVALVFFTGFAHGNEIQLAVWLYHQQRWHCRGDDNAWPMRNASLLSQCWVTLADCEATVCVEAEINKA